METAMVKVALSAINNLARALLDSGAGVNLFGLGRHPIQLR